jgi:hypothetical protein
MRIANITHGPELGLLIQHSMTPILHHSVFSSDHLIRSHQHVGRDRDANLLSGLEIDDQLELRRLLHGQIGRLRALQEYVDVCSSAPPQVNEIRSVVHDAAVLGPLRGLAHGGQSVLRRKLHKSLTVKQCEAPLNKNDRVELLFSHPSIGALKLIRISYLYGLNFHAQLTGRSLCLSHFVLV